MYGGENMALNGTERRKTENSRIALFKACVSGYVLTDLVRNTTVRNALQIYPLEERIQDYKSKWYNHILRMGS
jgi:hypothetical protein